MSINLNLTSSNEDPYKNATDKNNDQTMLFRDFIHILSPSTDLAEKAASGILKTVLTRMFIFHHL